MPSLCNLLSDSCELENFDSSSSPTVCCQSRSSTMDLRTMGSGCLVERYEEKQRLFHSDHWHWGRMGERVVSACTVSNGMFIERGWNCPLGTGIVCRLSIPSRCAIFLHFRHRRKRNFPFILLRKISHIVTLLIGLPYWFGVCWSRRRRSFLPETASS